LGEPHVVERQNHAVRDYSIHTRHESFATAIEICVDDRNAGLVLAVIALHRKGVESLHRRRRGKSPGIALNYEEIKFPRDNGREQLPECEVANPSEIHAQNTAVL
jgi:hypothetical protein